MVKCKECEHFSFLKGQCEKGYSEEACEEVERVKKMVSDEINELCKKYVFDDPYECPSDLQYDNCHLTITAAPPPSITIEGCLVVTGDACIEGDLQVMGKIIVGGLEVTSQDLKEFLQDREEKKEYLDARTSGLVLVNSDFGISADDMVSERSYVRGENVATGDTFIVGNVDGH